MIAHPCTTTTAHSVGSCSRRSFLTAVTLAQVYVTQRQAQAADVLRVGPDHQYTTIGAAISAAQPNATVLIDAGRYEEQLVVTSSITLATAQQDGSVVITCSTQQPYRHCLEVPSSSQAVEVTVQGIHFEHYSKSVANNYCIFAQGGSVHLDGCDITSSSGVGVGVEGAAVQLTRCRVHDCERHGVAVFGSLEGAPGRCEVSDCIVTSNKLNGILAKDGAEVVVSSSQLADNGQYGVQLSYCTADLKGNQVSRNKQGSVAVEIGTVTVDEEQIGASNMLSEPLTLL